MRTGLDFEKPGAAIDDGVTKTAGAIRAAKKAFSMVALTNVSLAKTDKTITGAAR